MAWRRWGGVAVVVGLAMLVAASAGCVGDKITTCEARSDFATAFFANCPGDVPADWSPATRCNCSQSEYTFFDCVANCVERQECGRATCIAGCRRPTCWADAGAGGGTGGGAAGGGTGGGATGGGTGGGAAGGGAGGGAGTTGTASFCTPGCSVATDCPGPSGYFECVGSACVRPACTSDADCTSTDPSYRCRTIASRARCVRPCTQDTDCASGKCVGTADDATKFCQTPCTTPADCTRGERACINGACGCGSNTDCAYTSDPTCAFPGQ